MNSNRDRVDRLIANLFIAKLAKHRQYNIQMSRKATGAQSKPKVKDTLPKKLSKEHYSKRKKKLACSPGTFQRNYNIKQNIEECPSFSIIPW